MRALLCWNDLFVDLPDAALDHMLATAAPSDYQPGDLLIRQGDPADGLSILTQGTAKLCQLTPDGHQTLVRYITCGQEFGLIALVPEQVYPLSIAAVTPCSALYWSGDTLVQAFLRFPRLGLNALRVMVVRNQETQLRYQELLTERVERRVALALLRLADQFGRTDEQGSILVDLPMTREDLAEFTGTTLFSTSRILRKWQLAGIIEPGRRVVLNDVAAIHTIAEADSLESGPIPCGR